MRVGSATGSGPTGGLNGGVGKNGAMLGDKDGINVGIKVGSAGIIDEKMLNDEISLKLLN